MRKATTAILLSALVVVMFSCSPKNISTKYYEQNKKLLDTIEETFKKTSLQHPYALVFTSKSFLPLNEWSKIVLLVIDEKDKS